MQVRIYTVALQGYELQITACAATHTLHESAWPCQTASTAESAGRLNSLVDKKKQAGNHSLPVD